MRDLRNGEAGNGEAGDEIRAEKGEVVVWSPLENGEEILKCEDELFEGGLVLETVERVVGEEDFGDSVSEFVECGSLWWQLHCMDFQRRCLGLDSEGGGFAVVEVFHSVRVHTHGFLLCVALFSWFSLFAVSLRRNHCDRANL